MELIDNWRRNFQNQSDSVVPTWQIGSDQPNPNDVGKFARDGYEKNSLIYACIREKATSFAPLKPVVVRADGSLIRDHRMIQLLENPNGHQDGQEFAETLKTQYEAAGNVYIQKHIESPDTNRRREFAGFPVQELELLRPDSVGIEPGSRPEGDVFTVTVGGKVVRRIPRAQMIHIREPHLTNDFYGLSKISVLVREGAIDLSMSDFELAFFRNAGVPMGMLAVKGRMNQEATDEVKTRFRSAYNGVRRWFDLLVLNSDTATYTPMGMKQSDMEMDSTRFHSESRICSVFGIPGVIVGARYSLSAGQSFNYEMAQHSFWAETMVPDVLRIARAWKKNLLPDFGTVQDRGADVTYDFTVVRALQEDRSRKLREVVRMINTGAFMVNQALSIVGMDPIDNGDFYVRTGNQVTIRINEAGEEEIITQPSPGAANPNNPLEGAARLSDADRAVNEALSIFRE